MRFDWKLYAEKDFIFFSVIALNFEMQIEMILGILRDLRKVEAWLKYNT